MTLSIEACLALRDMGYPQGITDPGYERFLDGAWTEYDRMPYRRSSGGMEYLDRPDPFTALDWLERECDIHWSRGTGGNYYAWEDAFEHDRPTAKNPNDLILAIFARWKSPTQKVQP